METTNLWNKLNLFRNKIIISLLAFILVSLGAFGQKRPRKTDVNLPYYDDRLLHYGFTIGMNSTRFNLVQSEQYVKSDTVLSALAPRYPGFSLGFIVNLKLADYFDFRLLPTVAFYQRSVNYILKNNQHVSQTDESTFIELPFLVKYKSQRRKNLRFYLVGGLKPAIEAGAKKKQKTQNDLRTQNYDLCVDYGFGLDIYYPLFKFSPEIRFSNGLLNLLNNDPNVYSRSLNRITSNTVTLYLHFE